MNQKENKPYDQIDLAISKTYFGNKDNTQKEGKKVNKRIELKKEKKNTEINTLKSHPVSKKFTHIPVMLLLIFIIVSGLLFSANYFFKNRTIFFTVVDTSSSETSSQITPLRLNNFRIPHGTKDTFSGSSHILFDFENDEEGWEIPPWAFDKPDHIAKEISRSSAMASNGVGSLECFVAFPSTKWSAAYLEIAEYLDFSGFDILAADIYVPPTKNSNIKAKFILTVGESWRFIEMSRRVKLTPGKWTTLIVDISNESQAWRKSVVDYEFRSNIRKLAIRLESQDKHAYFGPVYIDCVRLYKKSDD